MTGGLRLLRMKREGDTLAVRLEGELDHCAAASLRDQVEKRLRDREIVRLHLDFTDVSFMDSSGVGFVIGRYKTMAARGGRVTAQGLSPAVDRLFRMGGLHRLVEVTEGGAEDGQPDGDDV